MMKILFLLLLCVAGLAQLDTCVSDLDCPDGQWCDYANKRCAPANCRSIEKQCQFNPARPSNEGSSEVCVRGCLQGRQCLNMGGHNTCEGDSVCLSGICCPSDVVDKARDAVDGAGEGLFIYNSPACPLRPILVEASESE